MDQSERQGDIIEEKDQMGRRFFRVYGGHGEEGFGGALLLFSIILVSLSVISIILFSCGIDDNSHRNSRRSSTRRSSRGGIDGGRVGQDGGGGCRGGDGGGGGM